VTIDVPTFVEVQYWNSATASWTTGHAGINLMNPSTYVQKLAKRGTIARAIDKDTGQTVYGEGADLL
jgi:hypothetical protein